ncbi:heme lyase CcmF/NrfE family subunit [Polycladidibacter hongkongensis]|uniref:heme lyase CcmF/NrfE family subunit n=1 Tax=Polycladidibacter hongkongensis TaxID=1647556 RepID=UPI00082C7A7B|nr:heme lyase CcmF/NrfE family subunit [Pseudovibrio hongkongensis]
MIVELGHFMLILALVASLYQSVFPMWGAVNGDTRLMRTAAPVAHIIFAFVLLSFVALTYAYLTSDFSVLNVAENSHSDKPLIYKISGVWGNHEGSILLWVLILALFGSLVAGFSGKLPQNLKAATLGAQGWVSFAFLLFVILASNPFLRLANPPVQGRDLNPMLQDVGLAIHPPLLYVGYVGFSIVFSFAIAALIIGRIDAAWARWVRPWVLISWIFLTLGIAMGSYWAYYELGWGGWWFWDPVENASFMPWLTGSALLHSALVMEKRDALKVWTIFLAIVTFSLSLLGTFLVRSGVLTSVHAFAVDPSRGLFILAILMVFIVGSFVLFAMRAPALKQGGLFAPISREGALVLNNLFLTTATAAVFFGTLYPLLLEAATGEKISVGEPFFNLTFGPIMVPVLLLMPIGQLLTWKRSDLKGVTQRLSLVFALACVAAALLLWAEGGRQVFALIGFALAFWTILGSFWELVERVAPRKVGFARAWHRLIGLPKTVWSTALGHLGIGVTALGVLCVSQFESEKVLVMHPGETTSFQEYQLTYEGFEDLAGPNYQERVTSYSLSKDGEFVRKMHPSKRVYVASGRPMTETDIATFGFSQVYLAVGDPVGQSGLVTRIYHKPLILLIWIGCLIMSAGGTIALFDRRLRVAAPLSAKAHRKVANNTGDQQSAQS